MGILKNWIPPDGSDFRDNNFRQSSGIHFSMFLKKILVYYSLKF